MKWHRYILHYVYLCSQNDHSRENINLKTNENETSNTPLAIQRHFSQDYAGKADMYPLRLFFGMAEEQGFVRPQNHPETGIRGIELNDKPPPYKYK